MDGMRQPKAASRQDAEFVECDEEGEHTVVRVREVHSSHAPTPLFAGTTPNTIGVNGAVFELSQAL
jgi:hypothetical protein